MNLYHVQFGDFEGLAIFAESSEQAGHLVRIFLASNFVEDTCFRLSEPVGLPYISWKESYQLQAALALKVQGCGVYPDAVIFKAAALSQPVDGASVPPNHPIPATRSPNRRAHTAPPTPASKPLLQRAKPRSRAHPESVMKQTG